MGIDSHNLHPGFETVYRRTITREDILRFADLSGDRGIHHVNEHSRLLVHGLLVATLPTKLGGDLDFIAREMEFQFLKAVYDGETITCIGKIEKLQDQAKRYKAEFSFRCTNESGEIVMQGTSKGMIWK